MNEIPDRSDDGEIVNPELQYEPNASGTDDDIARDEADEANDMRFAEETEAIARQSRGDDELQVSQGEKDVETLRALEEALESFAGCAVVISHDRFFLDRLCTHILAFEGNSHVEWFEGNFEAYEEDKRRRMGDAADRPTRLAYKKLTR